jgi:Tol biopolymer transport system component
MYPQRMVMQTLRLGLLVTLVVLAVSACGGVEEYGPIVFGRHFAGERSDLTYSAIFAMNPDGSHVSQITHPPEGWKDDFPEWSADGQRLAFLRQAIDESTSRIMVLNTETGDARQVGGVMPTGREIEVKDVNGNSIHPPPQGFDPAFSPDGHSLAFKRILGPDTDAKRIEGIWIVGIDGSNPHQVTNVDPKLPAAFSDSWPQFSPDGKTLAFERTRLEDGRHAVFVQRIDSSGSPEDAYQLTPWQMNCGIAPEFSPDGKLVLFRCASMWFSPSGLYWIHPDGTGLHVIGFPIEPCCGPAGPPTARSYLGPGFSPSFSGGEGWITTLWFPSDYGPADVARMRIEDSEVVRTVNLTKSAWNESAPDWSTHPPVG